MLTRRELEETVINDRNIIIVLQRSVESLTIERDIYKHGIEAQRDRIHNLMEEIEELKEKLSDCERAIAQYE